MIDVSDLVKRLKDRQIGSIPWTDVKEIADLSTLDISRSGTRGITLFVYSQGERSEPDVRGAGPYLQTVTETIGVLVVAKVVNNNKFDFEPIRKTLRQRLFGWSPNEEHEPFWLGGGRLMNVQKGQVTWLETYITQYTEDQNRYGP
ncbi:phage tail terminator protein [Vibrio harveyi]|uniref:Virion structural protein n=1 Tax=Vibrio harveyi TaxID=669 RepID=A0ABN4L924_VIBHA|nr:hypothetical protein [Vibrio harveyi]AMG01352.1 hypothetical protein AL538_27270 [Vibrio harveyi]ELY1986519.1 hypothetical protein [Vibrio harveyi]